MPYIWHKIRPIFQNYIMALNLIKQFLETHKKVLKASKFAQIIRKMYSKTFFCYEYPSHEHPVLWTLYSMNASTWKGLLFHMLKS